MENSKSNFVEIVHVLLEDTEERKMFFKVRHLNTIIIVVSDKGFNDSDL